MRRIICRTLAILLCAMLCMNSALAESLVTATVSISVSGADLKLLTNLTIGDVEQPSEGKKLDQTAMVTSAEGIAWEIPVYWLDQAALVARADGTGWDTTEDNYDTSAKEH